MPKAEVVGAVTELMNSRKALENMHYEDNDEDKKKGREHVEKKRNEMFDEIITKLSKQEYNYLRGKSNIIHLRLDRIVGETGYQEEETSFSPGACLNVGNSIAFWILSQQLHRWEKRKISPKTVNIKVTLDWENDV